MGTRASAGMPKCGYGHHKHQLTESLSHTKRWKIPLARCFVTADSITSHYLLQSSTTAPRLLHLWSYVSSHCGIESYLGVKKSLDLIACLVPRIVGIDVKELSLWEIFGINSTCLKNELLQKHGGGDGGGGGGAGGRGPRIFKH